MHPENHYTCLIVDSEPSLEVNWPLKENEGFLRFQIVNTGEEALSVIAQEAKKISCVVINPLINAPGVLKLVSAIHMQRPATPIFLIATDQPAFTTQEFTRMAVHGVLDKPLRYVQFIEKMPALGALGSLHTFQQYSRSLAEPPPAPGISPDDGYMPVPAVDFFSGAISFFDVYVRLPSGKFLKVLDSNDTLEADRVVQFMQKGVSHLYLTQHSHHRCVSYCDSLVSILLDNPNVSDPMRVAHILSQGEELIRLLKQQELDDVHMDYLLAYVNSMSRLVRGESNRQDKKPGGSDGNLGGHADNQADNQADIVQAFLNQMSGYEHAIATTAIASLLSLPLKIESELTFRAIGMASLLHDIGLYRMSSSIQSEDEAAMSPTEREEYRKHPILGAELLRQIRRIDSIVVQAVQQHHERRDDTGFPQRLAPDEITRVAEIVGISDEFARLLDRKKRTRTVDVFQEMESRFKGFSLPVVEAFRTVFFKHP